jgi:hypothetical protein
MLKREEGRPTETLGAAPSAFLRLSDDGASELEQRTSLRRRTAALLLAGLVLVAAPFFWVATANGNAGDAPLAVKHDGNSGPGSGDDDEDNSGPGSGDDDPDATTDGTTATTGVSNTATNDTAATTTGDGSVVTATGTTQGTGPSNTNTNDTATGTNTGQTQTTATGTTTGTGPSNTNTNDTATGTKTTA